MNHFIADLHLGHQRIIEICHRPFKDTQEMDDEIIENLKRCLNKDDTLFILGDVALYYSKEALRFKLNQIKCRKYLIMGNHDRGHSVSWWLDAGFDKVSEYPIIFQDKYILSHEPIFMSNDMPYINLHGHTHNENSDNPRKINCSVEVTNYIPLHICTIDEIVYNRGLL